MDILLVLGSVSAKQYADLRLAMLSQGMKPRIIRVSTKMSQESDFVFAALDDALKIGIPDSDTKDYSESRIDELKELIIGESFGKLSLDDVKAIIWEPLGEGESSNSKMLWLVEELPMGTPEYTVTVGNDGSYWLQGAGLGDLVTSAR